MKQSSQLYCLIQFTLLVPDRSQPRRKLAHRVLYELPSNQNLQGDETMIRTIPVKNQLQTSIASRNVTPSSASSFFAVLLKALSSFAA